MRERPNGAFLAADTLATEWIFRGGEDGGALTARDAARFLASRESVPTGARAYQYLCERGTANALHFERVGAGMDTAGSGREESFWQDSREKPISIGIFVKDALSERNAGWLWNLENE